MIILAFITFKPNLQLVTFFSPCLHIIFVLNSKASSSIITLTVNLQAVQVRILSVGQILLLNFIPLHKYFIGLGIDVSKCLNNSCELVFTQQALTQLGQHVKYNCPNCKTNLTVTLYALPKWIPCLLFKNKQTKKTLNIDHILQKQFF